MPAIVPELIEMATKENTSTTELLRKSLIVAERLSLPDFYHWINNELSGYTDKAPPYRTHKGIPKLVNGSEIKFPLKIKRYAEIEQHLYIEVTESVPEIEATIKYNGMICRTIKPLEGSVQKSHHDHGYYPATVLEKTKSKSILEAIKNEVLKFALNLEKDGIKGEGMTFNSQEKEIAKHYKITNINGQIQIDSPRSSQSQTREIDTEKLCELVSALRKVLDKDNSMSSDGRSEIESELATLEAQAQSPKPKWPIVNAAALSLKSILENAAGGALASAALPLLSQFL